MNEPESSAPNIQKPVRKRPMWERLLVWGGILALLLVVLMEWKARQGYDATLSSLEERLTKGTFPLAELKELVHGYALRNEVVTATSRSVTLQWPSLFKQYKLRLTIDQDLVSHVEKVEAEEAPAKGLKV